MAKRRRINKMRLVIFTIILLFVIALGAGCGLLAGLVGNLPEWKPGDLINEATSFVYDYKGNYIGKLHETENRVPVEYKDIPKNLENAVLAIEDIRFYEHHGVSVRGIARAAFVDLTTGARTQGASTITQQLVKLAILENNEKTFKRKIQEALIAIQVERKYTKQEILMFYLNESYFAHGAYGVQAASQVYFGKDVKDLTLAESAMLAGILKSPGGYSPYLKEKNAYTRREIVLNSMQKYGYITEKQAEAAKKEKFKLVGLQERHKVSHPWFLDYVVGQAEKLLVEKGFDANSLYTGGLRVYTTINPTIQNAAVKAFNNDDNFPASKTANPIQGAMVVLEPQTGAIRALVGGREYVTKRGLNRATQMKRQPGSTLKPIVDYAPALEMGYSPGSVIDDIPSTFGSGKNAYSPENYDGRYRGLITMRNAIKDSVNVPAVKMLNEIGVNSGFAFGKKLGLPFKDRDKNLSLALGATELTPLDLASAYSAFANKGRRIPPYAITKITDRKGNVLIDNVQKSEKVMSEETAYLMTDMLRTVVNAGTGTRARITGRQVAGKTGTTQLDPDKFKGIKGNRDAWFAGYTPELVAIVWQGYDKDVDSKGNPQYQYKTYGGNYPAKIFKEVLQTALQEYPNKSFQKTNNIGYASIDSKSGLLPSQYTPSQFIVNEIFNKDNIPKKSSDRWVPAIIDPETHKLATNACPQRISGIFLKRKEHWSGKAPEDAYLELPGSYCPLHPGDPANSALPTLPPIISPDNTGGNPPLEEQQPIPPDYAPPMSGGIKDPQTNPSTGDHVY